MGPLPWYAVFSGAVVLSLFAALVLAGPVILLAQARASGHHGQVVLRAFVMVLVAMIVFGFFTRR